jgi:hypothetical protein
LYYKDKCFWKVTIFTFCRLAIGDGVLDPRSLSTSRRSFASVGTEQTRRSTREDELAEQLSSMRQEMTQLKTQQMTQQMWMQQVCIDHFPTISYLSLTKEIINLFCRCSVQLCNFRAVDLPLSRRPLSHAGHSLDL